MKSIILIIISILSINISAQNFISYKIKNNWHINSKTKRPLFKEVYYFDETPNIPYHMVTIDLPSNAEIENIELSNLKHHPVRKFNNLISKNLKTTINTKHRIFITQKQKQAQIWVAGAFNQNNLYTLLDEAEVKVNLKSARQNNKSQKEYPASSALSTGEWKKISIEKSGVYKITYSQIADWGLDNPQNIRLYGHGGKQLSFRVDSDDAYALTEIPIWMELGSDGVFNNGDYILFYGHGITNRYTVDGSVILKENDYTLKGHYFITTSKGPATLINSENYNSQTAIKTVDEFSDAKIINYRERNLNYSGRIFFSSPLQPGDRQTLTFNFPNLVSNSEVKISSQVGAICSGVTSYMRYYLNDQYINQVSINKSGTYDKGRGATFSTVIRPTDDQFSITYEYASSNVTAQGYIGHLTVIAKRKMTYNSEQQIMQDLSNLDDPGIIKYKIDNLPANSMVWDISDTENPVNIIKENTGTDEYTFNKPGDNKNIFIVFEASKALTPTLVGSIENQDLHGIGFYDFIIVSHPDFVDYAEELAEYHREYDNLSVLVIEPQLIYNEFSSGNQDATAIRNFLKTLYDKASNENEMPKHLLLFGDGSYDNISTANNTNKIPTFETYRIDTWLSVACDDFFVMLDEGEGGDELYESLNGSLDMGVGRFPVNTASEAQILLDKTINYMKNPNLGPWKNNLVFVGDDADPPTDYYLQGDAFELAEVIMRDYKWMNPKIILMDAYPQESTPAGQRYPEVTKAINGHIHNGTLIFNYTGHGSEERLAHEAILDKNIVKGWNNKYLPFFMTGSCEVSRFDNKNNQSLGEAILLKENGGAITLFSTTRVVFGGSNQTLSLNFYNNIFKPNEDGSYKTLGEVIQITKNKTSGNNMRNFMLFGNPALRLDIPPLRIITDSINGNIASNDLSTEVSDTLKALKKVTIKGHVVDSSKARVNFNGTIYPVVYDKIKSKTTLDNDNSGPYTFSEYSNILYKGKATVENGQFEFEFIVPIDINYEFGQGKISYYAEDDAVDAYGYFDNFLVGGSDTTDISDNSGPEISLFMNDTTFINGGTVDESPILLAHLFDDYGVNTTGNVIGHDLTATLNNDILNKIVLNDFYENDLNSYKSGKLEYQIINLEEGNHTVEVKAWDILNNSSSDLIEFTVANSEEVALKHVLNYPNPFTTKTSFLFEHNQPNEIIDVRIQVFTVSGKLIKTMETSVSGTQYMNNPIVWDGRDDFGDPIGRGVYIYKVRLSTPDGKSGEKFEKLVILR